MRSLLSLVGLLAVPAPAQVFVVDAANGAGAHFTDLPAAVAAVPDWATLRVRAGNYTPFTCTGKGLRILGEGAVTLAAAGDVVLAATRRDQVLLLRDLTLPRTGSVRVTDTQGPVILERCHRDPTLALLQPVEDVVALRAAQVQLLHCDFGRRLLPNGLPPPALHATDSELHLAGCSIDGNDGTSPAFGTRANPGGPALVLLRTRAVLSGCALTGGRGGAGVRSCGIGAVFDGAVGGPGCLAEAANLVLLDSLVQGGAGGPAGCCSITQQCTCPGSGGSGLALTSCVADVLGRQPRGGAPGGTTCGAQAGRPIVETGTNRLRVDPAARPPMARIEGTQAGGAPIDFTLLSPAGSLALMVLAYDGALTPIEPLGFGSLLRSPAGFLGPFTVPPGDVLRLGWTIPVGFAAGPVHFGQFLTSPGSEIYASNTFVLAVGR
jgi:hypothetical protein